MALESDVHWVAHENENGDDENLCRNEGTGGDVQLVEHEIRNDDDENRQQNDGSGGDVQLVEHENANDDDESRHQNDGTSGDVQSVEHENGNDNDENRHRNDETSGAVLEATEGESEDEDDDFNPYMKESPSEEASSSLSSEVEGVDAEVVISRGGGEAIPGPVGIDDEVECTVDDSREVEQVDVLCEDQEETGTVEEKESGRSDGNAVAEDVAQTNLDDWKDKPMINSDKDGPIFRRTRARHSLAEYTLDELETFLQETDDEDDIQNVDEEEEYRKFLAAVLNGDDQDNVEGNGDNDDDDEDNDADFEIEIQEALESDDDDCVMKSKISEEFERSGVRHRETRQNRRREDNVSYRNKPMQQGERPLRPLLPVMSTAASASCLGAKFMPNSSSVQDISSNVFVAHQIGQLHCLIYEHVQLLIQVYSICVLEPSRQQIASQVKGLLAELLHKRDLVLAWRNSPYSPSCFLPQNINSSVPGARFVLPGVSFSGTDGEGRTWFPSVDRPVLSVLDVEPLKLLGRFFEDVTDAVKEHQRRFVETTNINYEKQPLFPHSIAPSPEVNCNVAGGDGSTIDNSAVSLNDKAVKKTLAARIVENTKKQSLVLVHHQIAKLAKRFFLLFNPALFPYKPPPSSVANRVLFTDAEDVLLAMGIVEYNHDWKAIQQRFLPCKSEHQIFVRAKNRCSSKAPDNPIKTVRKLKTSPLTEAEKARIEEALKVFKFDWQLVWRTVVPYRDPNLLPRQWRIAIGTQKSYRVDPKKKEKHRIYEANRRNKIAAVGNSQTVSDKEDLQTVYCGGQNDNGDNRMENGNEAYVHEAFLADWRPASTGWNACNSTLSREITTGRCSELEQQQLPDNHVNKGSQSRNDRAHKVSAGSEDSPMVNKSFQGHLTPRYPPGVPALTRGSRSVLQSQSAQKPSNSNLVKLAPELPPVKLPPAVRVISQASLRSSQPEGSLEDGTGGRWLRSTVSDPTTVRCASNSVEPMQNTTNRVDFNSPNVSSEKDGLLNNRGLTREKCANLNSQMHPLLFRTIEEGQVPGYSFDSFGRIPTFSFFPSLQHHINGNLLQSSPLSGTAASRQSFMSKDIASTSSCLDFHPLLQRTNDFNLDSVGAVSTSSPLRTGLELSRDRYVEEIAYRADEGAGHLAASTTPASPTSVANDLDLDIHLSSVCKKRRISSREGAVANRTVTPVNVEQFVEGAKDTDMHSHLSQLGDHHSADLLESEHTEKSGSEDSDAELRRLSGSSAGCINDNAGDQPVLDIVMEQEELSDSDEEMENVEFECEEMTDSDGEEESVANQIVNAQYKEQANTTRVADMFSQHSESIKCDASEGIRSHRKGKASGLDSVRLGKGRTQGSWLSLNSHSSLQSLQPGSKSTTACENPLRPNRKSKKAILSTKNISTRDQTEVSQLESLPTSARKPRKQPSQTVST